MRRIGEKIRDLRESAGLSQEQLSERANIANRALQRIESGRGNPTVATLSAIADVLNVKLQIDDEANVDTPLTPQPRIQDLARVISDQADEIDRLKRERAAKPADPLLALSPDKWDIIRALDEMGSAAWAYVGLVATGDPKYKQILTDLARGVDAVRTLSTLASRAVNQKY